MGCGNWPRRQLASVILIWFQARESKCLKLPGGDFNDSKINLRPVFWIHVPKAGSSFATPLSHLICGPHLLPNETISEPGPGEPDEQVTEKVHYWRYSTETWNQRCGAGSFLRFASGHAPLWSDPKWDYDLPHVAMCFRRSRDRVLSGWSHDKHDCRWAANFSMYEKCVGACATRMLTGSRCGQENVEPNVDFAVSRMKRFGFVGLTNEYDLSVCLLHAMYGGDCLPVEFSNLRPGHYNKSDAELTVGYVTDDILYSHAEEVFWEHIRQYNVSRRACQTTICPKAASVFAVAIPTRIDANLDWSRWDYDWPGRLSYVED